MGEKIKKKWYKSWGIWVIAIIIIGVVNLNKDDTSTASKDASVQPSSSEAKKDEQKEETPKEAAKEEPKFDFSAAELNEENIKKAIGKVVGEELVSATITVENEKNIVDITYKPQNLWDENDMMRDTAKTATEAMEILFTNSKVDKVWLWTQASMRDEKGNSTDENVVNVALTKENAKDINWGKFKDMVTLDYMALFNIADGKYIHPGIAKNLK